MFRIMAPQVPQEAPTPKSTHPFGHIWEVIFQTFLYFWWKNSVLETHLFFWWLFCRIECFSRWAHMQPVHAGAVQMHFFIFISFLKIRSSKTSFGLHFGDDFRSKCHIWVKKGAPKKCLKKVAQTESNGYLLPCPGAPGQPPLFQRLLEQEATIWARNKNSCSDSNCNCNSMHFSMIWHALGKGPANFAWVACDFVISPHERMWCAWVCEWLDMAVYVCCMVDIASS